MLYFVCRHSSPELKLRLYSNRVVEVRGGVAFSHNPYHGPNDDDRRSTGASLNPLAQLKLELAFLFHFI